MRIDGEMSEYTKIERGLRQGCVFSPDVFNLYSEMILRKLAEMKGVHVGGKNKLQIR